MRRILPFATAALLSSTAALAQSTTSSITGTVADSTGAVLANATVTVTNTSTGVQQQGKSGPEGVYRISQLPPGNYTMKINSQGFEDQNIQGITLVVDQQARQDIKLNAGGSGQTVTVTGAPTLLDTVASNQGQVIENKQIIDLPLNGRDFLQLAQLSTGVSPSNINGMNSPASAWTGTQTVSVSVAGLREDDTSYLFDGIESRNAWYGAIGILPSIDNIQEFKIEQVGSTAAYGNAGTFVNVVSHSGTNALHGTVFEFLRNNDLDARNYFDQGAAPAFHQNQFGGSVGGPIKRNKLFFFLNYEGFRENAPTTDYSRVPTAAQRAGDFSADTQQLISPFTHLPYANNQIPTTDFSPAGLKALAYFPVSNGNFSGGNNYVNVQDTLTNWDQGSGRVDFAISQKDTVFGRYTQQTLQSTEPGLTFFGGRVFPSHPKNLATGWTHTF
ncbi:MAG: carboxypeptidase regulatory-like domain-containing protein, partial [Terriglobus roseus]|nr:carboxypeptidase regulatory-like domain-containing protein [Terriglobus roseus]